MRVFNTTSLAFDRAAFAQFLVTELGFTEAELHKINVYLYPGRTKKIVARNEKAEKITNGRCCYPSIFVYINGRSPGQVNKTLIHEASHYADHLCRRRALIAAYHRSPDAHYAMLAQILEQRRIDQETSYHQRPCELRARLFAELHASTEIITVAPVLAVAQ